MSKQNISRRTVLRGLGTAVALPWLEIMSPSALSSMSATRVGAKTAAPTRLAFFYVPNGMHMPDWNQKGKRLKASPILRPLRKHLDKINVYSGLTLDGARAHGDGPGDHARSVASFLTGAHPKKTDGKAIRNGISVDQVAAKKLGELTKFASLELGTEPSAPAGRCDSGYSCVYTSNISWRSDVSPVAKEINPTVLFDRLFGTSAATASRDAELRKNKYRKSILDLVQEDARKLQRNLGKTDQQKLEEYLYSLRSIEKRLESTDKLDQLESDIPDYPRPKNVPRKYDEHIELLMDVLTLAFQSDLTRVSSFMFANAGSNRSYRDIDVRDGHHDLSHHGNNAEKQEQIAKINLYHMNLFKHFVDRLDSIPEGDGTLLDNCMILYGSGIADGNQHAHHQLPIMTIGGGGEKFSTGNHFNLGKETPLTNLYLSMLKGVGVKTNKFGDSNGTIDGLIR